MGVEKSGDIITFEVSEVRVSYVVVIYTSQFHKHEKRSLFVSPDTLIWGSSTEGMSGRYFGRR